MGALVDIPIQEIAQTTFKNQSAIDAVNMTGNTVVAPASQTSLAWPILLAIGLVAYLL